MSKKGLVFDFRQHLEDYLSEFVYGALDGVVTTFAVVAGATGAGFSIRVILILGFANLIADGFSMGVGSYLSTKSEQELMVKRKESIKDEPSPVINGATTYVSFILVGLVPLVIYLADYVFSLQLQNIFLIACILTGVAFVAVGILKSRVAHAPYIRSIAETLVLGVIAAGLAFSLGDLLEKLIT